MVKHHFTSVLAKLRASDRTTALISAAKTGVMDLAAQLPHVPDTAALGEAAG
jgi:hypothetical protein